MTKENICAVHMKTIDHKAVVKLLHENVSKNEWILTLNGGNRWQKRTLRENSAIRHFTREFVGDITHFSIYSYIFMLL